MQLTALPRLPRGVWELHQIIAQPGSRAQAIISQFESSEYKQTQEKFTKRCLFSHLHILSATRFSKWTKILDGNAVGQVLTPKNYLQFFTLAKKITAPWSAWVCNHAFMHFIAIPIANKVKFMAIDVDCSLVLWLLICGSSCENILPIWTSH